MFKVNVIARNPKREELATKPLEELVDTGSELTRLPADVLKGPGITPRRKRIFATVAQQKIKREIGYAILSAEGYETNDEVVFAESGERTARRENFGGLCGYGGKHRPSVCGHYDNGSCCRPGIFVGAASIIVVSACQHNFPPLIAQ
jgi:hypothetical protein